MKSAELSIQDKIQIFLKEGLTGPLPEQQGEGKYGCGCMRVEFRSYSRGQKSSF